MVEKFIALLAGFIIGTISRLGYAGIMLLMAIEVIKISIFAVSVAFLESSVAKWRLFRIPDLIAVAIASSLIGLVLYYL